MTINRNLIATIALICLLTGLLTACSNSTITHSYVDPVLVKLDLDGVLVVAVAKTIKASSTNKLRNDAIASLIGDLKAQGLLN